MFRNLFGTPQIERTAEQQAAVDAQTKSLALYHYDSCPFCVRVRNSIESMGLNIEYRNIQLDRNHRQDLMAGGGKTQVPVLQITHDDGKVQWMYESGDIVNYLEQNFA